MPESSTCNAGDTVCTLRFNEPVDATSAESTGSYGRKFTTPGSNNLNSVSLGADGRTITLSFAAALQDDDQIRPATALTGVSDDDGQQSAQGYFDFVLPNVG